MSQDKIEVYVAAYEYALGETLEVLRGVPENKRFRVLQKGKAHPLWHVGHLAFSMDNDLYGVALGKTPELPGDYLEKFAAAEIGGGPITTNPDDYPSWDQLVAEYEKATKNCIAALRTVDDADLPGPSKGTPLEVWADFFAVLSVAVGGTADHDAYHRGQIGLLVALD